MAAPRGEPFTAFGLSFTAYVFDNPGDELPLHSHDFDHLTVPVHGELQAFSPDRAVDLAAGDEPVMFRSGRPHGLRAKTAGAVALNIARP